MDIDQQICLNLDHVTFPYLTLCIHINISCIILCRFLNLYFQGIFQWDNLDPVSHQPWKNLNDHKNKFIQKYTISFPYQCLNHKFSHTVQFWKLCPWVKKGVDSHVINKYKYANKIYVQIRRQCTLMLLTNLAEPEWVSINCHQKIIGDIMCMVPKDVNLINNISLNSDLIVFKYPCLFMLGKCYLFSWGFLNYTTVSRNTELKISKSTLVAMESLVTATNTDFPPFHSFYNLAIYCKVSRKWIAQKITKSHKGLHILTLFGSKFSKHGNVFECGQGIFVTYAHVCDGKKDCPTDIAFDEMDCICKTSFFPSRKCKYIVSKMKTRSCSLFYLTLKDGSCVFYGPVKINSSLTAINHVSTNRDGEEHSGFKYFSNTICQENGQLPCKGGYRKCYNITELCTYKLNKNNLLTACQTGEHVANCRMIECSMKFKCPGFYCIPWSYVCDGKWDCPKGYDEIKVLECGINRNCSNMFKCTNSQKCIHVGDVCDSVKDCPAEDDEYMCSLVGSLCPSPCACIGFTIVCYNVSNTNYLLSVPTTNAIFLNYCDHVFLKKLFRILKFPIFFSIKHNNLKSVCKNLPHLSKTLTIDLGFNFIEYVKPNCFRNGFQLISIKLNNNIISIFQRVVLLGMKHLRYLNLNNNLISALFLDYHILVPHLEILSIKNNRLSTISSRFFDNINVKIIMTDNHFICCKTPSKSMCTSAKFWFESCSHLLLQRSITVFAFCSSIFIIFCNVFLAFWQKQLLMQSKKKYSNFQCVALSINIIDLNWGIYLIFLVISNILFEDNFVIQESLWKSSLICFFLFSINLHFNILSPLISSFMSFSKLMVVMYPFNSNFRNRKFVLRCCITMYGFATTLVIGFSITFKYMYSNVPFRLCSPFVDPTHSNMMLTVTTCLVVSLQFIVYFLNILFSSKMICLLKDSISKKHNITSLVTQFCIFTVSNTVCWISSGIIFLICMFIDEFSITMLTWVVIKITSVNSITNSVIFIITTTRK